MGSGSGSEEETELASVEEEDEGGREYVKWRIRPMSLGRCRLSRYGFQPQSGRQGVEEITEAAVPSVVGVSCHPKLKRHTRLDCVQSSGNTQIYNIANMVVSSNLFRKEKRTHA